MAPPLSASRYFKSLPQQAPPSVRLSPGRPGRGFTRLSYQFGLVTISGIVPVSWVALLTVPVRVRDNC